MEITQEDLITLFAPLDLEQSLHFLDVLTWFPQDSPERWQNIAAYVAERCPDSAAHPSAVYKDLLNRILLQLNTDDATPQSCRGRWTLIPEPKKLYALKYNLMTFLYPDAWFTFMNMGYAPLDAEGPSIEVDPPERIMSFSAQLYHYVTSAVDLAGREVLEVGSGRGGGAAFLMRHHRPKMIVGLDHSSNNVSFCQRHHRIAGLEFVQADAENLPFAEESFDVVVNIESAHCYPSIERFLSEVYRVLRSGGYLLLADEWWTTNLDGLRTHLRQSGLEILKDEVITPNIIHALELLKKYYASFLPQMEDPTQQEVWQRFFEERVCKDSARSYISGRFDFLNFTLRKPT